MRTEDRSEGAEKRTAKRDATAEGQRSSRSDIETLGDLNPFVYPAQLSDEDVAALARMAQERVHSAIRLLTQESEPSAWIEARQYPALAAAWDNDSDTIFDTD